MKKIMIVLAMMSVTGALPIQMEGVTGDRDMPGVPLEKREVVVEERVEVEKRGGGEKRYQVVEVEGERVELKKRHVQL